jgi:hypothetical protein
MLPLIARQALAKEKYDGRRELHKSLKNGRKELPQSAIVCFIRNSVADAPGRISSHRYPKPPNHE